MAQRINPEAFTPGEYIREELAERGWTQMDLAEILGRPPQVVNEIIAGKRSITPETARGLGDAFGTSAQLWMNLEASYRLSRVSAKDDTVSRRALLYGLAPIKEMQRRGWIETTSNAEILETQVLSFFEISNLHQPIRFDHAARKSTDGSLTQAQLAWLYRARQLARALKVESKFSAGSLNAALTQLSKLKRDPEEVRHIPRVLSAAGIRFLIVEPLPHTKIDGVCFWLDADSPVIALSVRYDRIDWFWHTLMHEMAHVKNKDGMDSTTLDTDLVGVDAQPFEDKRDAEKAADLFAVNFLVSQSKLDRFIARVHPLYSKLKISAFANSNEVHPGIVVGQLQHRKKIAYAHSRDLLVKVRSSIIACALTDGWGSTVSA
jgi:HTH-type transcriptional regulator / antitoxin HigA